MRPDRPNGGVTLTRRLTRLAALCGLVLATSSALAQGGPPMVTDDPETPGDGNWEINLGATAQHTQSRWEVAVPDADINYGWGEHVQLKLELPWVTSREEGQHWKSGLGAADIGVKWRFIDADEAGFAMSTYPQYTHGTLTSSTRRGITGEGHQFFLPVEVAGKVGGFGFSAELGRNFVSGDGANQWIGGLVAGHGCGERVECMAEVHTTQSPRAHVTLLNFGAHWKLDDTFTLLGAAGRDFGTAGDERRQVLAYIGVQITR
jgi:hypothetical protein